MTKKNMSKKVNYNIMVFEKTQKKEFKIDL